MRREGSGRDGDQAAPRPPQAWVGGDSPFPRIGQYAFLSDCETTALVAPSGNVESHLAEPLEPDAEVYEALKLGLRDVFEAVRELRKRLRLVLSNAIIGFFFGVLPGHGATAASFLGYGLARQYSKNKENFGKGEISGIMGPQAAADSAGVASLVPMITLGIPGSPTSAVIMAGLFIWGLQPGPVLFIQHPDFVWGLIASIYLGHLLTFVLCLLAVPLLATVCVLAYAVAWFAMSGKP